ncbi:hypothetical protein HD554DRAFT_2176996 [Boletus coccyginus]|nr:hypothetical protein HD554DRAFT_2176996 [Boletus coccyginus]
MSGGDLLVLPAGIHHRPSLDMTNHVQTMKLFKDEPKCVSQPRTRDQCQPLRINYVKSIEAQ